jgi:hypothetical protein
MPPPPCATEEEIKIIMKNDLNKRKKIEIELEKIPINEQSTIIYIL